jgi:DNA-binding CsgD family transcriptional regulator
MDGCAPATRRLVEATAVLHDGSLATVASLARVEDSLGALEDAVLAGLLEVRDEPGIRDVAFPHPLVQAAVYEQLGPAHRARLHQHAAGLVTGDGARLRHRVAAADPPDDTLAAELSDFAERQSRTGAWAGAASALVEASHLSSTPHRRERYLLRAFDAMIGSGDLVQSAAFAKEIAAFAPGPYRDAALGYLAILNGKPDEAELLLRNAWERCDPDEDRRITAVTAQRWALHSVGRLRGDDIVSWARKAIELAPPGNPTRVEAEAVFGLGLALSGRIEDGIASYETFLEQTPGRPEENAAVGRIQMPLGWLELVSDDLPRARALLAATAPNQLRHGAIRIAVWSYVWLSRAEFLAGAWDEAAVAAARALTLLDETRHEWLRPAARWAAAAVPAARGDWRAAEEHARQATTHTGDYELMTVAGGLARAQLAAAQADHDAVLRALEPLHQLHPHPGIDEPGFWPWHALYADALVTAGRLDDADTFLTPHEQLATQRARRSTIALLAHARGRLEAAAGRPQPAEAAFRHGLAQLTGLHQPFPQALLELAYGQALRRHGQRRAAAEQLHAAHDRFTTLGARPYIERCERELSASGLTPAKRNDFDPSRLTAQELAVAQLVARGLSNRHVAAELFVSVKTVQFHLTRIYSKLRISSRAELAARFHKEAHEADDRVEAAQPESAASPSGNRRGESE